MGLADRRARAEEAQPPSAPTISVIIPTWNEVERLSATITAARSDDCEIVVVDGQSSDGTAALASQLGARVLQCERGRGQQLAAGAAAAKGELLLFLHADAILPAGYAGHVRSILADRATAIGGFELAIDAPGMRLRCIEWGVRRRCRWLKLPYGDQALFVRRETYRELGGIRPLPAMEDFDFVRRARRHGKVVIAPERVLTSARSWQRHGVVRTSVANMLCAIACTFGVSAERVAGWRRRQAQR